MAQQPVITAEFSAADKKRIQDKLDKVGAVQTPSIIIAFRRGLLEIENKVKENASGPIIHVRSGRLRSSIGSYTFGSDKELVGRVGSGQRTGQPVKYAGILETGGTIRPVKAKMLAIPLKAALTSAGVPRYTPREVPNSFIMRTKNGNLMIFAKSGKKRITPMFALVKSAKIPAFKYLSKSLTQSKAAAVKEIEQGINNVLSGK